MPHKKSLVKTKKGATEVAPKGEVTQCVTWLKWIVPISLNRQVEYGQ